MHKLLRTTLIWLCLASTSSYSDNLPNLGFEARTLLPARKEQLIGQIWRQHFEASELSYPDNIVKDYITYLGNRLSASAEQIDIKLHFHAIEEPSINAFASLGGNIAVHSGLIQLTESESELAAVMAHEIAHIVQQHVLRSIAHNQRMMPITLAEALAAVVIGQPNLILPVMAGHAQKMINFSREHEQEADLIGLRILAKAGFDPQGMPNIFFQMSRQARFNTLPPEYLLTHPLYESRISTTKQKAMAFAYTQAYDSLAYELVKARISVQASTNLKQLQQDLAEQLHSKRYQSEIITRYHLAQAYLKDNQLAQADTTLQPVVTAHPHHLLIQMAQADIQAANADLTGAYKRLQQLLEYYPDNSALLLQAATTALQLKQAQTAKAHILQHQARYPTHPESYVLLTRAEGMLGHTIGVHQAHAEYFALRGEFSDAIRALDFVLTQLKPKPTLKRAIEARKAALKAQHKLQESIR